MSEAPTVVEALSAVMEDVQAVRKSDRNTQQNFNFRGVDSVVNAVGPALRKHGVIVVPTRAAYDQERYQTKNGAAMRGVTATIGYRFYGPAGDFIDTEVLGEAADAGDKAIPKAHSVAFRTLLLQALCVPTDEPDPDGQSHERVNGSAGRSEAQATDDSAPRPADDMAGAIKPEDVIVHFGKNRGVRLGDLSKNQLDFYASTWSPTWSDSHDVTLKTAAELLAGLKAEPVPAGSDEIDDLPF